MARLPFAPATGEYKCLGSTFDGEVGPLSDETSFKEIYDSFKKRFPKADHYPYAYRLKDRGKSSDDGEPGSSAGRPLLSLLEEKDLYGYLIVARYFGGTKLGIPRLRRSILEAAELAISSARLGVEKQVYSYHLEVDYSAYQTILRLSEKYGFSLKETAFGIKVETTAISSAKLHPVFEKAGLSLDLLQDEQTITIIEEKVS
ncbi:MAG: YigZ family protein [Bacilli bacterium]|nr:YigZ family protein [Bacilli bacterium]